MGKSLIIRVPPDALTHPLEGAWTIYHMMHAADGLKITGEINPLATTGRYKCAHSRIVYYVIGVLHKPTCVGCDICSVSAWSFWSDYWVSSFTLSRHSQGQHLRHREKDHGSPSHGRGMS
jgi:hypothetical protein